MSCTLMGTRVSARSAFAGCPLAIRRTPVVQAPRTLVIENAHKKGAGSTKNGRDSNSKSRGVKVYGGQPVAHGGIIVRQVGNTVRIQRSDARAATVRMLLQPARLWQLTS